MMTWDCCVPLNVYSTQAPLGSFLGCLAIGLERREEL